MTYDSFGTLNVKTYLASDALPAPGALVRVYGVDELNREVEYSRITDENGSTGAIALPTPAVAFSLEPQAAERAYALYEAEIILEGFYTKKVHDIAVFDGVATILPVNMIPTSDSGAPRDTLDATSQENPNLE